MGADAGVRGHEANQMILDAIDLLVQIGIRYETRRVIAISSLMKDLKNGEIYFESLYHLDEEYAKVGYRWNHVSNKDDPVKNNQ
jgi:pilus assembly protein CpaF